MTKIVSWNVFAIITAVKLGKNSCELDTATRENPCKLNTATS